MNSKPLKRGTGGQTMTDREAIERLEICEWCGDCLTCAEHDEAIKLAISALKEREERIKGCKQCEGLVEINLYKYCPMCGRRLKG